MIFPVEGATVGSLREELMAYDDDMMVVMEDVPPAGIRHVLGLGTVVPAPGRPRAVLLVPGNDYRP